MVFTERCYQYPSSLFLDRMQSRGDFWYKLRCYDRRPKFLAQEAIRIRLRLLLAIIEARAVVIDASVHSDSDWLSLTVLCVSSLDPIKASSVFRKLVPNAIFEQISAVPQEIKKHLDSVATSWTPALGVLEGSRDILFSLLMEYRYLLAVRSEDLPDRSVWKEVVRSRQQGKSLCFNLLFFEHSGELFSVPEFQVERIEGGCLCIGEQWGGKRIEYDDVLWTSVVSAADLRVVRRTQTAGHCVSRAFIDGRSIDFVFVVPSFL